MRVTHKTSTLIDNVFIKSDLQLLVRSYVVTDNMSDHFPCVVSHVLSNQETSDDCIVIQKQKLTNEATAKIQQDLLFYDWSILYDPSQSVEESYEFFLNAIDYVLDKHAPIKRVVLKQDNKFHEPWVTVNLQKCNNKSHKLCMHAKLSRKEIDFVRYKTYRNTLNKIKMVEKCVHYRNLFEKIGRNSKLFWDIVNGILKKMNNKTDIVELNYNGKSLTDRSKIYEALNEHFSTAGKCVQDSITPVNASCISDPLLGVMNVTNKMTFSHVSEQHICKLVNGLVSKRSCGPDGLSNLLLKMLINVIKGPLCILFNKSLHHGIFPDLLKLVRVIPLHKSGESILDNYIPISLLPFISKVLEKIVYQKLVEHLNINEVLYPHQFGFRKGHSTSDAVMNLVGETLHAFEDKSMVLSIFIDLKKAFDMVSHLVILVKLGKLGVSGTEYEWFTSYLTGRKQFVDLGGKHHSSEKKSKHWCSTRLVARSIVISDNNK